MSNYNLVDPMHLDFSRTCRLCLHQSSELTPINSEIVSSDFAVKIMACVSIEVTADNTIMPKNLCSKCIEQIDNWIKFKELCESMNTLLNQCLANLQSSNDESENLKFNLHGPDNAILPDMVDVSLLEDSLFNQFEDVSLELSEDLNVSFSESLLDQRVQSQNKKQLESEPSNDVVISKIVTLNQSDENMLSKDVENLNSQTDKIELNVHSKWKNRYNRMYRKEFPCDLCNKSFSKFTLLLRHDRTDHGDCMKNVCCPVCGVLFVSQSRLEVHILKHREKTFECPHCHKMMLSKKSLSVHVRMHSANKKFICNVCNVVKASSSMLNDHLRCVHLKESPFRCELCGKMFTTNQGREKHRNLHLNQKLYMCNICGCPQRNSASYKSHMATHSTEMKVVCHICGKFFKANSLLKGHMETHLSTNQFKCLVCQRSFPKRYLLARHQVTHLDLHPFSCIYCHKRYKRKDFLTAHLRTHTGEKRYSCKLCLTAYLSLSSLKKHKCPAKEINYNN